MFFSLQGNKTEMNGTFVGRLALTFVVGGFWVAGAFALADRAGTKIGGWASGLPSTVVVALFFIGVSQTPRVAAEAAVMVPLAAGVNGLFLVPFVRFSRRGFAAGFFGAFMAWFSAAALSRIKTVSLAWSIGGCAAILLVSRVLMNRATTAPSMRRGETKSRSCALAGRAVAGGLIVASAVAVAKLSGPLLEGIFAAFPGVFSSTILVAYHANGLYFARAIAKPMMFSGLINVGVYGAAVRLAYPLFGLGAGTVIAYGASLASAFLLFMFMARSS
jgi:hypothetical protein